MTLKIKDSTGKTVGVLKDDDDAPEMVIYTNEELGELPAKECSCKDSKMINCKCKEEEGEEDTEKNV